MLALALAVATAAVTIAVMRKSGPATAPSLSPSPAPVVALDTLGMRTTSLQLETDGLLDVPNRDLLGGMPDLGQGVVP